MDTPEKRKQLEQLADEIFELTKLASQARTMARKGEVESLTETEHLTLDLLSRTEVMSVGEIQKAVGVLPAQMSRIVRGLEDKAGTPYITCAINPQDRRKIDVTLTAEGRKAHNKYRAARMESILRTLAVLDVPEREEFMRILRKIRDSVAKAIHDN